MHRQQIMIVVLTVLLTAPWPIATSASAEPATGRPALPTPPDLDQWASILASLKPPPLEPGAVAIRPVQQELALRGGALRAARAMPGWGGEALVIERGVYSLEELARAAGRPDLLLCRSDGCELRAPLLVGVGAGLVIEGTPASPLRLRLHQEAGAFAVNLGTLHIDRATILGWSSSADAPAQTGGKGFRPFIAAFGASESVILRSELDHLGFMGAKAYGLTLSSHPRLFPGMRPSGRIFASRFNQLYYGLYTYEARAVVVVGNVFSDSHRYGIDPHDGSSQLLIARNEIHGTRGHGLVLSKGVHDSWIVENTSRNNAKSGLLVDASSWQNKIVANRLIDNQGDGIAIFESHRNVIAFNQIERNGGVGIRVRASADNIVANNTIAGSGEYGLKAYGWSDNPQPMPPDKQEHERPVSLTLFGNHFADNALGACQFKAVREVIAYPDAAGALPCDAAMPQSGEPSASEAWSKIPGKPEALRLVLTGQ